MALAALVVVSASLRFAAALAVPTPWIAPDEMLYALLGRDLWEHGSLSVLRGDTPFYSLVYPALAGLPLSVGRVDAGYAALKAIQAVLMSLAAVPVYLWGRTFVRPWWAVAAAALTLTVPGLAYAGLVMTEVAFFPVLVLAAWATAAAIREPTLRRQALLGAVVVLAVATRLQAVVLVPAIVTAIVLESLLAREPRRLRASWPTFAVAAAALLASAARGSAGLGGYAAAATSSYSAGEAAEYVGYHAADLVLLCGVLPACALTLLLVRAVAAREPSAGARAFLAVAASFVLWIVVEVGVFASEHAHRIEERDLIGLAPVLFLALALWLDRGAPRTYVVSATTALAAAALVLALPLDRFVTEAGVPDSFTFAAVVRLLAQHPGVDATLVVALPAAVLAAAFALLPRRLLPALAALVGVALAAASVSASLQIRDESSRKQLRLLGENPHWIDDAADGPVAYLYGGSAFWNATWAHAFWNRRIAHVYDLPGYDVPGALPQARVDVRGDGILRVRGREIPERFVLLPTRLTAFGTKIASTTLADSDQLGFDLWRLDGRPRLRDEITGLQPNGDLYTGARIRAYGCTGGSFLVTLLGKTDARVDFLLDGRLVREIPMHEGDSAQVVISAQPNGAPGSVACTLDLRPTSTVGVTQIEYAR